MRGVFSIFFLILVASCGVVKKKTTYAKTPKVTVEASENLSVSEENTEKNIEKSVLSKADEIINTALTFSGVRYKYGGTTRKGMDCSGLLYVTFGEHNIKLPRTSYHMAEEGKRIRIEHVTKGDLLFFRTLRRGKRINHVGLVVSVEDDDIKFIHASSSRGVIVSSLREGYWNYAFIKATRIL
ncbi:C40 family peptidase [Ulvibacterium sp.]|uniref:C40 family peptidase n=1 Tax=Ulvibacterium sp. TaxID=2665914 RepID=UPI00261C2B63|nr:C40 family peptidase [Ulvibacterium sp.]